MNQAPHHFSNGYQYLPDQQKLLDANGQEIQLRPQSLQVLNLLPKTTKSPLAIWRKPLPAIPMTLTHWYS